MREAGDVCFADTYKDGTGVVEFLRYDDMKYAIKKLDDSRFRSHEVCDRNACNLLTFQNEKNCSDKWSFFSQQGEVAYVRVREDVGEDSRRSSRR